MSHGFYDRREWRELRYRVLRKYGFTCMSCKVEKSKGVVIHVDHIKPISIYPELALREDNLQVLCKDCNLGKSNKFDDDHRPQHPKPLPGRRRLVRRLKDVPLERRHGVFIARLTRFIVNKIAKAEEHRDASGHSHWMRAYLNLQRKAKDIPAIDPTMEPA